MQPTKRKDPTYKVLLIGDSGVGKTSLIMAALNMEFNVNIPSTIEAGSAGLIQRRSSSPNV